MATISQSRALAGSRAFTIVKANTKPRAASNGAKYFMKRSDAFLVEVNVREDETEDSAVRRYMRDVLSTGVLNELRYRKTKEPKVEKYKRELKQRIDAVKAGVRQPTYHELYNLEGLPAEHGPFQDFFNQAEGVDAMEALISTGAEPEDLFGNVDNNNAQWGNYGSYVDRNFGGYGSGGYKSDVSTPGYRSDVGGYINSQ
jgi:ribosomal protein S21